MTTFASCYSGIGGADCGFCIAGWEPMWQCEIDGYRSRILKRRFDVAIHPAIEIIPYRSDVAAVDVLYGELPDHRIERWWPPLMHVATIVAQRWIVCEMSPTVPCDRVLIDLALGGWTVRLLHLRVVLSVDGVDASEADVRNRAFILASRNRSEMNAIKMAGNYAELILTGAAVSQYERLSIPWYEVARGFPVDWTCACENDPCTCDQRQRIEALSDATSPHLAQWLAETIDGRWSDGITRQLTHADGAGSNVCRRAV